jgi:hypothetical protein
MVQWRESSVGENIHVDEHFPRRAESKSPAWDDPGLSTPASSRTVAPRTVHPLIAFRERQEEARVKGNHCDAKTGQSAWPRRLLAIGIGVVTVGVCLSLGWFSGSSSLCSSAAATAREVLANQLMSAVGTTGTRELATVLSFRNVGTDSVGQGTHHCSATVAIDLDRVQDIVGKEAKNRNQRNVGLIAAMTIGAVLPDGYRLKYQAQTLDDGALQVTLTPP